MKLEEMIESIKTTEKIIFKKNSEEEIANNWKEMGCFNPWYVINENGNIIRYIWHDAWSSKKICIIVKWDKLYNKCKLFYEGYSKLLDTYIEKKFILNKKTILELEYYLTENNFYEYFVTEEEKNKYITLDEDCCNLEIKINNRYNEESIVAGAKNNKIIYNFGYILFKLSEEEPMN